MARQKVGNRVTMGLGLNDGIPEQARVIEWVRASGKTPSEVLWEAVLLRMDGIVPSETFAATAPADTRGLAALKEELMREINTLRAEIKELKERPAVVQAAPSETVEKVVDETTGEVSYKPLPPDEPGRMVTREEAMNWAKSTKRPGLRLEQ